MNTEEEEARIRAGLSLNAMNDLLLFLVIFPKIVALLLLCNMLYIFRRMRRKNHVDPWVYFGIGMVGYNVFVSWTYGWLQHLELVMMLLCLIGMFITQAHSIWKMRKEVKQWDAQRNHINDALRRIDEARTWWERGDITGAQFETILQEIQQEREKQRAQEQMLMH